MYIRIERDDKEVFTLDGSRNGTAEWGITEISGTDTIENFIYTAVPAVGDGAEITGERIPERNIDISASVKNRKRNVLERRRALSFFNPKHRFTLFVTKGEVTRWITARIERFQCREQPPDKHVFLQTALLCESPYFYSVDNYGRDIAEVKGCFGFPYLSAINRGFKVGVYNFDKKVEIENTGDVETYIKIVIKADGEVENPKIIQNDVFIRLLDRLISGDTVEIDMVANTIRKNGENCIGKVDRQSSFSGMVLYPGDNTISFDADNGDTNMKVFLYYNLRYMGV